MLTFLSLIIWVALGYGAVQGGLALRRARRRRLGWLSKDELRQLEAQASRLGGPLARGLRTRPAISERGDQGLRRLVDRSLRTLAQQEADRRDMRELLAEHSQRDLEAGTPLRRADDLKNLRQRERALEQSASTIADHLESLQIGLLAEGETAEVTDTLAALEVATAYVKAKEDLSALAAPAPHVPSRSDPKNQS